MPRKSHVYFGVNITPATNGAARIQGCCWQAYLGRFLYADTLEGMKRLIRETRKRA